MSRTASFSFVLQSFSSIFFGFTRRAQAVGLSRFDEQQLQTRFFFWSSSEGELAVSVFGFSLNPPLRHRVFPVGLPELAVHAVRPKLEPSRPTFLLGEEPRHVFFLRSLLFQVLQPFWDGEHRGCAFVRSFGRPRRLFCVVEESGVVRFGGEGRDVRGVLSTTFRFLILLSALLLCVAVSQLPPLL